MLYMGVIWIITASQRMKCQNKENPLMNLLCVMDLVHLMIVGPKSQRNPLMTHC